MRIGWILDWMNPNIQEAARLLEERGATLELIYPEKMLIDLDKVKVENDLYLVKSGTPLAMSLAGALHSLGAATLNPYPIVNLMRNKIVVTRVLRAVGVPTPETYVTGSRADLASLLEGGPIIIKPFMGSRGVGISIVKSPKELEEVPDWPEDEPILVQRYYQSDDGRDHKLFRIGDDVLGVRRIWPLRTYEDKLGEPFVVPQELRDIMLRAGRALGISLYGLDIVISQGKPYVVDINKFGSYMGVPNAPKLLADYLFDAGRRAQLSGPLPLVKEAMADRAAA